MSVLIRISVHAHRFLPAEPAFLSRDVNNTTTNTNTNTTNTNTTTTNTSEFGVSVSSGL